MKHGRQLRRRFIIREAVEPLKVVGAPSARIIPAVSLVNIIARKGRGGPVMAVGARFGVYKKPVQQTKPQREGVMVRSDLLSRAAGPRCGSADPKDCQVGISVCGLP